MIPVKRKIKRRKAKQESAQGIKTELVMDLSLFNLGRYVKKGRRWIPMSDLEITPNSSKNRDIAIKIEKS